MHSIQKLVNIWGSLMDFTGATIRTDQSRWYLADYIHKHRKWVLYGKLTDICLLAITSDGPRVTLERLQYDIASEIFGIWMVLSDSKTKLIR